MTATASYLTAESDVEALDIASSGWAVVEAKFQELRALLSAPTTGLNASQAREEQKRYVSAAIAKLLDRAQAECRRLLVMGNAKAAVEGGLKTLKLKEEYYGAGSLQLVPAYFHLARTNQYMDKFKRAEEFLSLAQYEVLRHPEADIALHAELHQTFGLLYASDGKLDAALKQLTCSTYYLSCMHGPEHVLTSFGYFDIGNVFAAKSHMEHAMAFYDRVKNIWETYLADALQRQLDSEATGGGPTPESFGEENVHDAAKMLRGIVGLQTERYGQIHPSPAHGEYVLGMFLMWSGDTAEGYETLLRALEIYKRVVGERHPRCQGIRLLLVNHGHPVPEDTTGALPDDAATAGSAVDANDGAAAAADESGNAGPATKNGSGPSTTFSRPASSGAAAAPTAQRSSRKSSNAAAPTEAPAAASPPASEAAQDTTASVDGTVDAAGNINNEAAAAPATEEHTEPVTTAPDAAPTEEAAAAAAPTDGATAAETTDETHETNAAGAAHDAAAPLTAAEAADPGIAPLGAPEPPQENGSEQRQQPAEEAATTDEAPAPPAAAEPSSTAADGGPDDAASADPAAVAAPPLAANGDDANAAPPADEMVATAAL